MDSDDPDLEAFKSNLCRILGERELGKAAALVSNLCPNASERIKQRQCSTQIPLWHIISVGFGGFT